MRGNTRRCQAENPLIALSSFLEPALTEQGINSRQKGINSALSGRNRELSAKSIRAPMEPLFRVRHLSVH
jgi:hypothetical protein